MTSDPVVHLRVSPNAKRSELQGTCGDSAIELRVAAPPEVERFFVRGLSSRDKTVFAGRIEPARVREVLTSPRR